MTKLLNAPVIEAAHSLHEQTLDASSSKKNGVELTTATSIWTDSVKQSFWQIAKSNHFADAFPLQKQNLFASINKWVSDNTNGMIKDLFDPSTPPDPNMMAVLVNTIYFKGAWREPFDASKTVDGLFRTGSKELPARYMTASRKMKAIEHCEELGGASVLALDYGQVSDEIPIPEFFAIFILPADSSDASMNNLILGLKSQPMAEILRKTSMRSEVKLQLPRFKLKYGPSSLVKSLKQLGMVDAFDSSKSELFNEMTNDPLTYVDDIFHGTAMEVTEEGTVAAAATAAVMRTRSIVMPIELTFNRPFVVSILHRPSGLPLFMGRVESPELFFGSESGKSDEL